MGHQFVKSYNIQTKGIVLHALSFAPYSNYTRFFSLQLKPSYLGHFYLNSQPVIWNVCGEQNFFIRQFFYSNKIKFTQVQKSVKKQLSTFVWANTLILELNAGSHLISPSQTLTLEGALHSITTFFRFQSAFSNICGIFYFLLG